MIPECPGKQYRVSLIRCLISLKSSRYSQTCRDVTFGFVNDLNAAWLTVNIDHLISLKPQVDVPCTVQDSVYIRLENRISNDWAGTSRFMNLTVDFMWTVYFHIIWSLNMHDVCSSTYDKISGVTDFMLLAEYSSLNVAFLYSPVIMSEI